jgi:hypothetical protein
MTDLLSLTPFPLPLGMIEKPQKSAEVPGSSRCPEARFHSTRRKNCSGHGTGYSRKRIAEPERHALRVPPLTTTGIIKMKKISTAMAVAFGVAALAACNQSPKEEAADNIEANAENVADTIEANADNATDVMEANAQNTADEVRAEGENAADAVREGTDADGNSAN